MDPINASTEESPSNIPNRSIAADSSISSDFRANSLVLDESIEKDDELPLCQSYSDMDESIRAQHRYSYWKNFCIHLFHKFFLRFDSKISSTSMPFITRCTSRSVDVQNLPKLWSLNYLEASIYLEEGLNNDKFDHHPHLFPKIPMYLLTHNRFIYSIDFLCCWLILLLALAEKPAIDKYHLPETIHSSIELICLFTLVLISSLKLGWIGRSKFFRHTRTLIKTIVLILMIIEAIIVLWRQDSHFRVTRSLRPMFLIDNFYFYGVRRVVRQTMQSLRSFCEMLALLIILLIFFSISAFYLFSSIPNYQQFSTIIQSFLSLFVLLTTANFPDVMMPAYQKNRFYSLFFIIFLVINLYFFLNILLAVVYNSFSRIEKDKFRKLFLHRRKACDHAFRLLITSSNTQSIQFKHFCGLLDYLKPRSNHLERFLMYEALCRKLLNSHEDSFDKVKKSKSIDVIGMDLKKDSDRALTLDKFYYIYEVMNMKWKNISESEKPWFNNCYPNFIRFLLNKIRFIVLHQYFDLYVYSLIILAALYQLSDALANCIWSSNSASSFLTDSSSIVSSIFISLYTIELILKLLIMGFYEYFTVRWNIFDFVITITSLIALISNEFLMKTTLSTSLFSLRSLRLLDLLRNRIACYRDILGPLALIIIKRFTSMAMVIIIVYYFFAIIAMECFGQYSLKDCCVNTTLEPYYQSNGSTTSLYYLNNFQDLITSYVTLFELMVVNNWQIPMQAYVIVTENSWSQLFFITFYVISLVVITIVISFVLDTFNFHIEYKHRFGPSDSISFKHSIEMPIKSKEMIKYESTRQNSNAIRNSLQQIFSRLRNNLTPESSSINALDADLEFRSTDYLASNQSLQNDSNFIVFRGEKMRDKFSFNLRMYHNQLDKWIQESVNF
ncbi:mediator of RNA polymerase II transcription subunit 6 [Sarcoptes scabiei]|nr:mediator of RNA polymerase II transcription subunit 6 [Sarcoptes scabiei]